jgi:Reverse transcriptase (RNA-dependent DNA polymerase)
LNSITVKDRYPIPLISDLQEHTAESRWYTKIDLKEAYYLIRIKEGHEWKTTFRTKYGQYEYLVLSFGLTNAPATFQRLINEMLHEYLDDFVITYLDDILISTNKGREHHLRQARKVLKKLEEKGFKINMQKTKTAVSEVEFLGTVINHEGIRMDPDKIKAVKVWPEPKTVKEVQGFLGLTNYYRRFVQGYVEKAEPLIWLLKKDTRFI